MLNTIKKTKRKLELIKPHIPQKLTYEHPNYSICYTHQKYSFITGILLCFLITVSIISLIDGVIPIEDLYRTPLQILIAFPFIIGVLFYFLFLTWSLDAHKFLFYPLVCLVIGYSYSLILKHIFSIEINLFFITCILATGLFLYSFFVREFYTFRFYFYGTIVSLPISYAIVLIIMSTLYNTGVPINYLSYSGVWMFLIFNFCYVKAFRHRFHAISGFIALVISFICTNTIFNTWGGHLSPRLNIDKFFDPFTFINIWGNQHSSSTMLHNLNDAFIFIGIYGIIISYLTLFRTQPEPYALQVSATQENNSPTSLKRSE